MTNTIDLEEMADRLRAAGLVTDVATATSVLTGYARDKFIWVYKKADIAVEHPELTPDQCNKVWEYLLENCDDSDDLPFCLQDAIEDLQEEVAQ